MGEKFQAAGAGVRVQYTGSTYGGRAVERRWARWGRDEWLQRVAWGGRRARVQRSRLANKRAQLLGDEGCCVVLMVPTTVTEVPRGSRLRLQRLLQSAKARAASADDGL